MSKADEARKLLLEGWSVADVSRATGAHYSQVHGIAKKLKETNASVENATKARSSGTASPQQPRNVRAGVEGTRAVRQPSRPVQVADSVAPDSSPAEWDLRPDDEDAGPCAECGLPLVERAISYGGRDYGRSLIHTFKSRGVEPTPQQLKSIERHTASRAEEREGRQAEARLGKRRVTTPVKPMLPAKVVGPAKRQLLRAKGRNV